MGDRYGWRPLPEEIPADEFEQILGKVTPEECNSLLWQQGRTVGGSGWYRRDDNAVPQVYHLQPQTGAFVDPEAWGSVERRLWEALRRAATALGLGEDRRRVYEASATEQEIWLEFCTYFDDATR